MKNTQKNFTAQKSVQVAIHTIPGNNKKNSNNPEQNAKNIMDKAAAGPSKSMKNAGKCCIHIKKRTDKGKHFYVSSGCYTSKKQRSEKGSGKKEKNETGTAKENTAFTGFYGNIPDMFFSSKSLHLCNRRHQHYRSGVGKSSRKKNKRKCHSCENPVDT